MLREHLAGVVDAGAKSSVPTAPTRMPAEAVYERAMALVLQVICDG
jgi:hypothetical protein